MDRFFSVFGKVMLVVLLLGLLTYGSFYFGFKSKTYDNKETQKVENISSENLVPSPIPSSISSVTVSGGVSKSAGLSFEQYKILISPDWIVKRENQTTTDEKLILTKDSYQISIFQAATGGALCLYPNDADFEGPSSRFPIFKEITTKDGKLFRRSGELNGNSFTVCQKYTDGSFGQPTNFGHISIKLPDIWNQQILNEIDLILASLEQI